MRDELDEFSGCVPGLALCDIGWNRNCRSSHLRYEAKLLFRREPPSERVNELGQLDAFLPNVKIFVTLGFYLHLGVLPDVMSHVTCHSSLALACVARDRRQTQSRSRRTRHNRKAGRETTERSLDRQSSPSREILEGSGGLQRRARKSRAS